MSDDDGLTSAQFSRDYGQSQNKASTLLNDRRRHERALMAARQQGFASGHPLIETPKRRIACIDNLLAVLNPDQE